MKSEHIWVVDDDPIFLMIFRMTLKKCFPEYVVSEYNDGKAACDAFSELSKSDQPLPHSIFMDINMPVMNGWQCMDKLEVILASGKIKKPNLFIVSSSINPADEKKANSYSIISEYLVKPLTIDVLKQIFD